ncbi:MAG: RNA polymerase sigma-70 factor (ECF subfamily) [Pirellulaceae bacterium]|jgi:RNA polymerase sigma-70 factor (ECF subfamily)
MDESMDITELIQHAKAGDSAASGQLFQQIRPRMRYIARGILGESLAARIDTSDLVQESLAQVLTGLPTFRGTSEKEWMGWIRKIMHTEACRLRRHHYAAKRSSLRERYVAATKVDESRLQPLEQVSQAEQKERVATAITHLSKTMQEIIRRRVFLNESFSDIALQLGKTAAAVRVGWTRAIQRVAAELEVASETSSIL